MRSPLRRFGVVTLRLGVVAASCLGIWSSWAMAKADYLFHLDTKESIHAALRLEPDAWEYSMRLAQLDEEHAQQLLEASIGLAPYNAQADIELGLRFEAVGNYSRAEKFLQDAFAVDHTFLPRWSLANFYFRRGNGTEFWAWARSAAEMPSDDMGPLFELCWHVSPDADAIAASIINNNPKLIRQYITFLLAKDQLRPASTVALRLVNAGKAGEAASDRVLLLEIVNRLVAAGDATAAKGLWNLLIQKDWVIADITVPNNAGFSREPLPVSFDWSLPEYSGLHSWPGPSGLEVEFTGEQPEDCLIAEQILILPPGVYAFAYSYRTKDIPAGTGINWQLTDARTNAALAVSSDLSSAALTTSAMTFSVPPNSAFVRLRLSYRRSPGTPRISGLLMVQSTGIGGKPS